MPPMERGSCYPIAERMTAWDVMRRWPHTSRHGPGRLANGAGGRPPLLQPCEAGIPPGGKPGEEAMRLHMPKQDAVQQHQD